MRETENCELIFLKHKQCKQVIGEKVEKIVNEVFHECDNRVCYYNDYLERFSFKRRKVIGLAITIPQDWLKKLAPHFHPIRSKTKTNRDALARDFPRFASATCNYYEF